MFYVNFDLFRKKIRCDEKKEQHKEEGVPTKRRRISGPAISDDDIQVLDRKQIHKEFECKIHKGKFVEIQEYAGYLFAIFKN